MESTLSIFPYQTLTFVHYKDKAFISIYQIYFKKLLYYFIRYSSFYFVSLQCQTIKHIKMEHINDVSELQEFEFKKNYATESSYVKALEKHTRITLNDIESVFNFVKVTFNSFKLERKCTSFTRWQQLDTDWSNWLISDYLDIDNVKGFNELLEEKKEIELYSKLNYRIKITKYNNYYMVSVDTFAHIKLLEGTIQWLDVEQAKLMIARKINSIHKK